MHHKSLILHRAPGVWCVKVEKCLESNGGILEDLENKKRHVTTMTYYITLDQSRRSKVVQLFYISRLTHTSLRYVT